MGRMTDLKIAQWQEKTGIEPAKGKFGEMLSEVSRKAYELIQIIELERSGIRDGDGMWHGSDPLGGTIHDIHSLWEREG